MYPSHLRLCSLLDDLLHKFLALPNLALISADSLIIHPLVFIVYCPIFTVAGITLSSLLRASPLYALFFLTLLSLASASTRRHFLIPASYRAQLVWRFLLYTHFSYVYD